MSAYSSTKHHVGINGKGYVISQRGGVKRYQKKRSPSFVNKFGGGDSSYRDATFWQYFVQTNWRNGAKQLKFDDPGKFWKSSDVDTTQLEELSLSKQFESAGQLASGEKVECLEAWRSSVSWWDANYGYRQQITVTNNATATLPENYPVKITVDTDALQTASKVRSDRKDWRVVYWNGSSWEDLTRDYISASVTFFPTQATIASGASDSNYYIYYGYSSESTDKQPTTTAGWNEVYGMYGTTPDANTIAMWHFREGTGTSVTDDSGNSKTLTGQNSPSWGTDGKLGRYISLNGTNQYLSSGVDDYFDLGSWTLEAWVYLPASVSGGALVSKSSAGTAKTYKINLNTSWGGEWEGGTITNTTSLSADTWYHIAFTHDGAGASASTVKLFLNGSQDTIKTGQSVTTASGGNFTIGRWDQDANQYVKTRIQHFRVSNTARTSFPYVLDTEPTTSTGTELTTQPPATSFDLYGGATDGKIYKWDGTTTWTEQFDCRRMEWYETGTDANKVVGDTGGTETGQAQSFQLDANSSIKGVSVYLKKAAGTPGNITVNVETNSSTVPSGSLVNAAATGTITAFTETDYGWYTVEFSTAVSLSASTVYWITLTTAAAGNDNNYTWAADDSSPSYSAGNMAASTDGGSSWSAVAGSDAYFRVLGNETSVNCMLVTSVGGTQKLYAGTGDPDGETNGDARLYSYDGTNWALTNIFATSTESVINSMAEYVATSKVYFGIGPQAKIYETSDFSTFTLSKDINIPQNPGYVYTIKEYNSVLHAGGGSPEFLPTQYYNGFVNIYDTTQWRILYPFDFTVIKSMEFYDAYLFMGTYRGDLYVYDTATLNPLFNLRDQYEYDAEIKCMKYFDDKLYLGLYPQTNSNETNVGIWNFERHGLSLVHTITDVTGYRCFAVCNGSLFVGTGDDGYVYKLSTTNYKTQGWYQSSYFDANLPSIDKLYNNVTIRHDPLLTGQSIVVYYRFKEADDWTTLGTSNTVGDIEKVLSFSTATYSKKITLKVELNTTNQTNSPKLTEVIMQYSLYPPLKWTWTMKLLAKKNLILLDKTTESSSASTVRGELEALMDSQTLYSFTDIDETSYTVLVHDIDQNSWVVNKDDVNEDEVTITLLEA